MAISLNRNTYSITSTHKSSSICSLPDSNKFSFVVQKTIANLFILYQSGCLNDNLSSIWDPANSIFFNLQFIDAGTMVSPTVYARRSLCYLMSDMPQDALNDAMQAQIISPIWHIASYLQAAALSAMGMENEAQVALKEGTTLEAKKNSTAGQK